jgi:hypothetical protein
MYIYPSIKQVRIGKKVGANGLSNLGSCNNATNLYASGSVPEASAATRAEFEVISVSPSSSNLTVRLFNSTNSLTFEHTIADSETSLQTAGQWGLMGFSDTGIAATSDFDNVAIYSADIPAAVDLSMSADKSTIKYGDSVVLTLTDDEDQTVTLSDNGAGGTFSPSATVVLNSGNSYSQQVTYTPARAGEFEISGTANNFAGQVESNIFVLPYAPKIGFIGDSITDGNRCSSGNYPSVVAADLLDMTQYKFGTSGATTKSYLASYLAAAKASFKTNGVEIVHIMLGTNDSKTSESISPDDYKNNLQAIIDQLTDPSVGVKKVILSYPMSSYLGNDVAAQAKLAAFIPMIDELVDGETVLLGDTQALADFRTNMGTLTCDTAHPNQAGNVQLGTYWANAIKSNLEYQINPDKVWVSNVDEHQLDQAGTLTLSIDKYLGEFSNVVKVDNETLNAEDYTATAGSTEIELSNTFLNTLAVGNHTLSAEFYGGVNVSSDFTILAANTDDDTDGDDTDDDNADGDDTDEDNTDDDNANGDDSTGGSNTGGGNTGNDQTGNSGLTAPDTGLFGLSKSTTVSLFGVIATASLISTILLGRKLLAKKS